LTINEKQTATLYPKINVKNPQKFWSIHGTSDGKLRFRSETDDISIMELSKFSISLLKDAYLTKAGPILTLEETDAGTYYPRLDIKNPQRTWRIQGASDGRLIIYDVTAGASRFTLDSEGKLSSLSAVAQNLLPDGDATRTLGSSTLRWSDVRTALLNGWNPDAHASRHEYGGADLIHNLDYLAIRGYTIIDTARQLQNISTIIQDVFQTKSSPVFRMTETASGSTYPRLELYNPQRNWRIFNSSDGSLNIIDVSAAVYRLRFFYSTAPDSEQLRIVNSAGTTIMSIDYEGDVTIAGKLTQSGCPQFSKMTLDEIKQFITESRDKEYHKTQEEVMALIHLVLNLAERVEQLERKLAG
jgi:hypothetical protein